MFHFTVFSAVLLRSGFCFTPGSVSKNSGGPESIRCVSACQPDPLGQGILIRAEPLPRAIICIHEALVSHCAQSRLSVYVNMQRDSATSVRSITCTVAQTSTRIELGSPDTPVLNTQLPVRPLCLSAFLLLCSSLHHLLQEQLVFRNLLPLFSAGG